MNDFSCLLADLRPLNFCSFNWILDSFLLYHNIPPQKSGDVFTTIISRFLSYHILVCLKNQPHFSISLKQISGINLPSHIIQRVIIDDDLCPLRLDAFHDFLDTALAEIIRIRLHRQAVPADRHRFLLARIILTVIVVIAGNLKNLIGDIVLSRPIRLHDRFDQIFRHTLIIGQKLLCIFWLAITTITQRWVVSYLYRIST